MSKKYNGNKTEFLFECDAEKAVLNEAMRPKRKKIYKRLIINATLIAVFVFSLFSYLGNYKDIEISKIKGSVIDIFAINDQLNSYSKNLSEYNIIYKNKYEVLVNSKNKISEEDLKNYEIVNINNNLYDNLKLEKETYEYYTLLKNNLLQKGYYINIKSGYQSPNETKLVYNYYLNNKSKAYADKNLALPYTTEHNTGLAFDYILSNKNNDFGSSYNGEEFEYLEKTAHIYGFIIRYPKDKEKITGYDYAPWHLRYVGVDLAKYLKKNNLTLEEYYK